MKKYRLTFTFKKTEEEAKEWCDLMNKESTYYIRKNKPAHYTPWGDENENTYHYICWYYI